MEVEGEVWDVVLDLPQSTGVFDTKDLVLVKGLFGPVTRELSKSLFNHRTGGTVYFFPDCEHPARRSNADTEATPLHRRLLRLRQLSSYMGWVDMFMSLQRVEREEDVSEGSARWKRIGLAMSQLAENNESVALAPGKMVSLTLVCTSRRRKGGEVQTIKARGILWFFLRSYMGTYAI